MFTGGFLPLCSPVVFKAASDLGKIKESVGKFFRMLILVSIAGATLGISLSFHICVEVSNELKEMNANKVNHNPRTLIRYILIIFPTIIFNDLNFWAWKLAEEFLGIWFYVIAEVGIPFLGHLMDFLHKKFASVVASFCQSRTKEVPDSCP